MGDDDTNKQAEKVGEALRDALWLLEDAGHEALLAGEGAVAGRAFTAAAILRRFQATGAAPAAKAAPKEEPKAVKPPRVRKPRAPKGLAKQTSIPGSAGNGGVTVRVDGKVLEAAGDA
jgi:hypothetical protein